MPLSKTKTMRFLTPIYHYSEPKQHGRFIVQGTKKTSGNISSDGSYEGGQAQVNLNQTSRNIPSFSSN